LKESAGCKKFLNLKKNKKKIIDLREKKILKRGVTTSRWVGLEKFCIT